MQTFIDQAAWQNLMVKMSFNHCEIHKKQAEFITQHL